MSDKKTTWSKILGLIGLTPPASAGNEQQEVTEEQLNKLQQELQEKATLAGQVAQLTTDLNAARESAANAATLQARVDELTTDVAAHDASNTAAIAALTEAGITLEEGQTLADGISALAGKAGDEHTTTASKGDKFEPTDKAYDQFDHNKKADAMMDGIDTTGK